MNQQGTLRVQSFAQRLTSAVPEVLITVTGPGFSRTFLTDAEGTAPDLAIEAPPQVLSLTENPSAQPYAAVTLTAEKAGWQRQVIQGIQIFPCQTTLATLEMIPVNESTPGRQRVESVQIPPHPLYAGEGGSGPGPDPEGSPQVLDQVIIPKNITVHLGKPAASARNVTVSFRKYIANVASSEVYPTWPEQALRANIHAQISLALNRIYTEWYPSKGYRFNITNSTSYDQYFVYGRTIFDVMERITDDIFNTYVRRSGTIEPYYTEYCDGKTVTCPGMKQWGTVTLANQGRSALQILRNYYGSRVEIVRTQNIQSIPSSYPGSPLRRGDSGTSVATIQRQLNRIAKDYPFFGTVSVDGSFGASTETLVKRFQKQFNLTQDGVIGRATWYKISYIYVSVKDLAELTSEGETVSGSLSSGAWDGTALRVGSTGAAVEQVQFWLNTLSQFNSALPSLTVDGVYGSGTAAAVRIFQREAGLTADGVVGQATWNALYAAWRSVEEDLNQNGASAYPGTALRRGDRGSSVKLVQFWLRIAADNYSALAAVTVDGVFGAATEAAVTAFQRYFSLTADGVVGRATWNKLNQVYLDITNKLLSPNQRPGDYPGVLRRGSRGTAVRELQYYLILAAAYDSTLPSLTIDGVFGPATKAAVKAYQRSEGLTADGVVGRVTWDALVNNTARLRPSGPMVVADLPAWPGRTLAEGDTGTDVLNLTRMLRLTAFWYPTVASPDWTVSYDPAVTEAVQAFQLQFELPVTGRVDETTWNTLLAVYESLLAGPPLTAASRPAYPGKAQRQGSAGAPVRQVQQWLNRLAMGQECVPYLEEDGVFGAATEQAVQRFQAACGLEECGQVQAETWAALRLAAGNGHDPL